MRIREMRELTTEELGVRIGETRKELLELRFQLAARKLENPAKLRLTRKRLARLLTVQTEVETTPQAIK
jgi:large subunit ribosomal protein L29